MRACILNFRYWMDEPGDDVMWFYSENHALMFHTCQLLAGELYPSETFFQQRHDGRTDAAESEGPAAGMVPGFLNEGFTEWNSSAYLPIDLLGLASLYARTQDGELRALAKRGMDYVFYLLAVHSRKGFFRRVLRTHVPQGAVRKLVQLHIVHELDRLWLRHSGPRGQGRGFPLPVGLRAAAGLCGLFQCRAGF